MDVQSYARQWADRKGKRWSELKSDDYSQIRADWEASENRTFWLQFDICAGVIFVLALLAPSLLVLFSVVALTALLLTFMAWLRLTERIYM